MVHILPHWTWPGREGQVTPVHAFTSGDEAELFVNGTSQGRKKKAPFEYRLRWDYVTYAPGEITVVAYKDGKEWARSSRKTAGQAAAVELSVDRAKIAGDGKDLAFITARILDAQGNPVPRADNRITFAANGGVLVATDNGDATDLEAFPSPQRKAFNGLALAIVRGSAGKDIRVTAEAAGLRAGSVSVKKA